MENSFITGLNFAFIYMTMCSRLRILYGEFYFLSSNSQRIGTKVKN